MSRNFTIKAQCLGTTLSWDCGDKAASHMVETIEYELNADCLANQEAGNGLCGHVTHKLDGLPAFYKIGKLADWLWKHGATGKALLLREFTHEYRNVLKSSQELSHSLPFVLQDTTGDRLAFIADSVLDEVAKLNIDIGLPIAVMKLKDQCMLSQAMPPAELLMLIGRESWALSITVTATY